MQKNGRPENQIIQWGVACQAFMGSEHSGDAYAVKISDHMALVAVMDGLGHGEEAAVASGIAVDIITKYAFEGDLSSIIKRCHEGLKGTRGSVISLASFSVKEKTMNWLGIGNVEGLIKRADSGVNPAKESLFLTGGVVGYQIPILHPSVLPIYPGDILIFTTDGISSGFVNEINLENSPQEIANEVIAKYSKKTDDSLVLAARYRG